MPRRVLLFDDDASLRESLSEPLAHVDATLTAVGTEAQVIGAAQSGRPDLVLVSEQRGRNVRLVCERLARAPALSGVPMVAIVASATKVPDPKEAIVAFVSRADGPSGVVSAVRRVFDGVKHATTTPAAADDEDLDFTLVPDDELAATRLSHLSMAPVITPARTKPSSAEAPRPKSRASVRPPSDRKADAKRTEKAARPSARPPAEKPSRSDAKRTSAHPPVEKSARRSLRPPPDREAEPPPAPRPRASSKETASGSGADVEKRVRDLEELLAAARRERDESDAAWSEWVTSAEQFANEMWADRETLRKAHSAVQRALQAASEDARLAKQRENAERERRELLTAEVASFRKDASRRASMAPPSHDVAAMARTMEEVSALRRQLADAMQKLQVSESTRNDAERNADKLRVALDAAEAQSQRSHAELAAERDRVAKGGALSGGAADREELRKLRERLGAEQKRAIAISVELSTTKREGEQKLRSVRTEATTALESLREKLGGELTAARERLEQLTLKLDDRERERDDARARLHGVEAEREALARSLAEREATLSEEASRAEEASQRVASVTDEFAEWRRRAEDERAERERVWTEQLAAQEKLYTGIADALRGELDEVRTAKREIERREAEARASAEKTGRALDEMRAAFEAEAGETNRAVRARAEQERGALETTLQKAQRDVAALGIERDALRAELGRTIERIRAAESARDETKALHAQALAERDAATKHDEESARQVKALRVSVEQEKRRVLEANAARESIERDLRAEIEQARADGRAALERARSENQQIAEQQARRVDAAEARYREQGTRVESLERELEQAKQSRDEIVRTLENELQQVDGARIRVDEANARAGALEVQLESERANVRRAQGETREAIESAKRRADEREHEHERAIALREKAIGEARAERDAVRREIESLQQAHAIELRALEDRVATERHEAAEGDAKLRAEVERELAGARQALLDAEARERTAREDLQRDRAQRSAVDDQLARNEASRRELRTAVDSLTTQLDEARTLSERERSRADAVARDAELAERTARTAMERTEETHRAEIAALTTRVRTLETAAGDESTRSRAALAAAEERAAAARKERDESAAQIAKLQNDRTILQRQIETARGEYAKREAALRDEAARATKERDQARGEQAVALSELRAELDRTKSNATETEARASELTLALETAQTERERLEQALRGAEDALAEERRAFAEKSQGAAQHDEEIARSRAALVEVEAQLAAERKRTAETERAALAARASLESDLAAARDDATIVAASLRAAQEQIDSLEDGLELREAVAASIREERDQLVQRRSRDEESLVESRRALEDARRDLLEAQARVQELEQRMAEIQREAEARVELLRTQSNAAMRTLRSRVDGDSEKVRRRFEELSTWLTEAEKRAGDLMSETEHQRRLREKAERALAASEHSVRELGSRLEVERAQTEELAEQLEFERKRFEEIQSAATRTVTRTSRPDTPDLRAELERLKSERARIEKDLSTQLADLSTGLMARDAAIANLRQQLGRAERAARKKTRPDDGVTDRNPLPSQDLLDRLQTLERERDAARVDFLRRVQEIERDYTERLIAMARADGSQVMFALSERVVALQNASARPISGEDATRALEEEIEALRRENEFLLAEIERNARGNEK